MSVSDVCVCYNIENVKEQHQGRAERQSIQRDVCVFTLCGCMLQGFFSFTLCIVCIMPNHNCCYALQAHKIQDKLSQDLVPTMVNGWKFWVPAASVNFYAIPLQWQVLYMSGCGVLWTAYLSFVSYNSANAMVRTASETKKLGN